MSWLTTASAANKVTREERTIKEQWVYAFTPPKTFTRTITTTVYDYVGIDASAQAALCAAIRAADTTGKLVDCYYSEGTAGGGTIHCVEIVGTPWVVT